MNWRGDGVGSGEGTSREGGKMFVESARGWRGKKKRVHS